MSNVKMYELNIKSHLCHHFPAIHRKVYCMYIQGVSERTVQSVVLEPFRNLMVYRVE